MLMLRLRFSLHAVLLVAGMGLAAAARADDLSEVQRLYYAGQAGNAMQRADAFLTLHPKDPQMRFMKGVMLADAKREQEAIAQFQKLSEDYPDLAEPYNNLAALYAAAGDYAKARATLEQALRTNPGYATAHENLGDIYAALAAQSYQRALKLDPTNVTVPPKLALVREMYKHPGIGAVSASPRGDPSLAAASVPSAQPPSAPTDPPASH
jgi:tetratricopeptide (TPR) repeat protein